MNDWIKHDGGKRPDFPHGTKVNVQCRGDAPDLDPYVYDPFTDIVWENWDHAPDLDIVAYRVVLPDPPV